MADDWPEPKLDRFRPHWIRFQPEPENVHSDRRHWDHHYSNPGELGRLSIPVAFVGEDGFGNIYETLVGDTIEVLPDTYGGIVAIQDAAMDYVGLSRVILSADGDSPEYVTDAVAISRDPLVAAAAVRAWYDRQVGNYNGYLVWKGDHYDNQRRREERERWRDDGVTFQLARAESEWECERCGVAIEAEARVWTATIPPGREKEGRCSVCARAIANGAENEGYTLNGPDPRAFDLPPRGEP